MQKSKSTWMCREVHRTGRPEEEPEEAEKEEEKEEEEDNEEKPGSVNTPCVYRVC